MERGRGGGGPDLRATHETLILVVQGAHHGRRVLLLHLLGGPGRLCSLLQLLLVQGELDGVGGRLGAQVVHAGLQPLVGAGRDLWETILIKPLGLLIYHQV